MEATNRLWGQLKDSEEYVPSWLVESIGTYLDKQLDEYANDPVGNQVIALRTLQELAAYPNPMFQQVFMEAISLVKNHIEQSPEKEEVENIMRGNNIMNTSGRELSSDADFFHLLYQKGIVTDDGMQRHRTSQFYALVSTFSDLVGEERKGRTYGSRKTPPIPLQDWLVEWEYLEARNKELSHGDLSALSNKSNKELLCCLLFPTEKLPLAIYQDMYDDMCANAIICYTFLVLAAGLVQRSKETTWNPDTVFKEAKRVLSYVQNVIEKVGGNAFLVLGAMLLVIIYQRLLMPYQIKLPTNFASYLADTFDPNKIKITNRANFSFEFKSLCAQLEKDCQAGLTEEDAIVFGIPQSFVFPWWHFLKKHSQPIALWDELKEEMLAKKSSENVKEKELPKTITEAMDSLVSGFQVESGAPTEVGLASYSVMELHQILKKHQNQMLRQVIQGDVDALWETIATNLVIAEEVQEQLKAESFIGMTSMEHSLLGQDLLKMDYQNKKYIGIVEAAKPDASIQEYATSHKKQLLHSLLEKCNPA